MKIYEGDHEVDRSPKLVYTLGVTRQSVEKSISSSLPNKMKKYARKKISEVGDGADLKRVIPGQVGSSSDEWWELWSLERFAELCDRLIVEADLGIAHESHSERDAVADMTKTMRNSLPALDEKTSIQQVAAILASSQFLVASF